jgi:hypothetical protein
MNKETKEILVEGLILLEDKCKGRIEDTNLEDPEPLRKLATVLELKTSLQEKQSSE